MISRGGLYVVSGPSGVGKGTVCAEVSAQNPNIFLSVSATSRSPRRGEVDGVHYYFKTKQQFEEMIENDEFLEYAEYLGNYYGTPKAPCLEQMEKGNDVILEIEVQGGSMVKKKSPGAILIFVAPPTIDSLTERLAGRGTDSYEEIKQRVLRAREELAFIGRYDYIVINDTVQNAVDAIKSILTARHYTNKNMLDIVVNELEL